MYSQQVLSNFVRTCPPDVIAYNYDVLYTNDDVTTPPHSSSSLRTCPRVVITPPHSSSSLHHTPPPLLRSSSALLRPKNPGRTACILLLA